MAEKETDEDAVQLCWSLCASAKDSGDPGVIRKTAAVLAQRCSNQPKSVQVLWKEMDDRESNLLQNVLTVFEKCNDGALAVSLVRVLEMFVRRLAKGRQKRVRLVVALNGVTSILKCLLTFIQQPSADFETIEPLVYLVLFLGGNDKKFHVKVRLTGVLKAAVELCKTHVPVSLSVFDLLITSAQSVPNALLLGKNKEMVPYLLTVIRSAMEHDSDLCRKSLELAYYLAKIRKNRPRLLSAKGIELMLDLFACYFSSISDNESAMKMCLIALGTLRLLTRSKSGQQELVECNGLKVFKDAAQSCLDCYEGNGWSPVSKELDAAICTVCLRCLPAKPLPADLLENPLRFELPVDADRQPADERSDSDEDNNEAGASDADEENVIVDEPMLKRERWKASELEETYGKLCTEFNAPGATSRLLLKPLRSVVSYDQAGLAELMKGNAVASAEAATVRTGENRRRRSCSVGEMHSRNTGQKGNATIAGTTSKLENAFSKLAPIASFVRRLSLEETSKWKQAKPLDYTSDEFTKHAMETKSVVPFCKVAYPEFTAGYPNLPLQPLKDASSALLERVIGEIDKANSPSPFNTRTVFDLDQLLRQFPKRDTLTNGDAKRIGKPDATCDYLKFESRFESGNLRKAVQVGTHEYELFLNADINQLQHHYLWFYFEVSNMEPNVQYTFTIANCVKSQSLFQTGMQPVVFSVSEAAAGRPGWARCGRTVVYYKNRYMRPGKKSNDAKSFYSSSFTVSFRHAYDVCYLAYHYPYTYSMLRTHLSKLQDSLMNRRDIYARRDVLCRTLGSNPIDLITITATAKPNVIAKRDCVVLSARVHPGEANSSWMMHGTIEFLLSDSPKAKEAREKYVFKLIPMLNPDGVINGNHRCSLAGQDLNRQWARPSAVIHPTIHHTKGLLAYLHSIGKAPFVYCDYHGHSRKNNIFVYGNNPQLSWCPADHSLVHNYDFYALPEILDELAPGFWLKYSSFVIQKEKEASARVAVWREMGVCRSYTMEASYGGFDRGPYQGYQIGTHQCIEMGQRFCEALAVLKDRVANNQPPTRKFEENVEENVQPSALVTTSAVPNPDEYQM